MTIGLLFIFIVLCVVVDLALRAVLQRVRAARQLREREQALAVSLQLDFTREAKSLKRVEVNDPAARILCVDDEAIILDSFRRILVLDGYSIDTVETGQEALGLIQARHYDFVFTDLRMPAMDGVEVVKAVKHMRPDIDVIIVTGYASVETAVECMKHGAMDYVQKPFTEEELRAFVKKVLIKRTARIEQQLKPQIHITHLAGADNGRAGEFAIPGGVLISGGHCWVSVAEDGGARVGLDDFARKVIGKIDGLELPNVGMTVQVGQPLFTVTQGGRRVVFHAPLSGRVTQVNRNLEEGLEELAITPYHANWVCQIEGDHLDVEMPALKIGQSAVALFQQDIERFLAFMRNEGGGEGTTSEAVCVGALGRLSADAWDRAAKEFFGR